MTSSTDTASAETTSLELSPAHRFAWGQAVLGFVFTLFAALVLSAGFLAGLERAFEAKAMPGVTVAGVPISGLDRGAAEARLREALPSLSSGKLTLSVDDSRTTISFAQIRRDYEIGAMLDEAFGIGREGNPVEQAVSRINGLIHEFEVPASARYDAGAVQARVRAALARAGIEPVDASASLDRRSGRFQVTEGTDGRRAAQQEAQARVATALDSTSADDVVVRLSSERVAPTVTTQEALDAVRQARAMTAADLTLAVEAKSFRITSGTLKQWLGFEVTPGGGYAPTVRPAPVRDTLAGLVGQVDRAPRDARFRLSGERVVAVVPAVPGRQLDVATAVERIRRALSTANGGNGLRVALPMASTPASFTTAEAQAVARKIRRLPGGTWTTHFVPSVKNFWGRNISIPTARIDGYVVEPGEWFDFWKAVGSISRAQGFGLGGAIINGRTEPTGALAGGICSCSTTLFNAAARAGLQMGARRNHYYYITRYPKGLDATVFRSSSGSTQTMSFRNDTAYPILIRGINAYGIVRFDLYGVPPGRRVSFSRPVVRNYRSAGDSIEYTTALAPGQRRRVDYPADGFNATVTRTVRDASGRIIHRDTWYSHYAVIRGIVQVGVARTPRAAGAGAGTPSASTAGRGATATPRSGG
ncbi:MAG: VanW family protein [Chloroflexota bacterium]|nr:VanW family protein [Chloroflexota bacterium]